MLWNQRFKYRVHNSLPLLRIRTQINPAQNQPTCLKSILILCFYLRLVIKVVHVLHIIFKKTLYDLRFSPVCAKCPATFIPIDFIMLIILHELNILRSSTFCRFLQPPFTFSMLCPNVFFRTLLSNTPGLCSSFNVKDHDSQLYKITGKVLCYVFQFPHFQITGGKIKYSETKGSKHSYNLI